MSIELSYDSINHIHQFLPYYELCKIRLLDLFFRDMYRMPKMKSIIKHEKATAKIKMLMRQYVSKSIARHKFIKKILIDPSFREKYIYIHQDPEPHVCIKNWTPYFSKIVLHNIIVFRKSIAQKTYDRVAEVLENIPESQWNHYLKTFLLT